MVVSDKLESHLILETWNESKIYRIN